MTNVHEPSRYYFVPTSDGLADQPQVLDQALLRLGGQVVTPSNIYAFGGSRFCPLTKPARMGSLLSDVNPSSKQFRGNSTRMSVDVNDHPISIVADGPEQAIYRPSALADGLSPSRSGFSSNMMDIPRDSRIADPIKNLDTMLDDRISSTDAGDQGCDNSPPILPLAPSVSSLKLYGSVSNRDESFFARPTRRKRRRTTQDSIHHEHDSNEQKPSAEDVLRLPVSRNSLCRSSHTSLSRVVPFKAILDQHKAKRRRLANNSLPLSLLFSLDQVTPSPGDGVSTLAKRLDSIFVSTATEKTDSSSPPGFPQEHGIGRRTGSLIAPGHLSPLQNVFSPTVKHQIELNQLRGLRKRRAAKACRKKHGGEGFSRMKARHRRRALRKAISEPSTPGFRIQRGTPAPQIFEPLAVVLEPKGSYYGWYRCESPDEASVYDPSEEKQNMEELEELATTIMQPAPRPLLPDIEGEQTSSGHPVEMCRADSSSGAFNVRALTNALQALLPSSDMDY